MTTAREDANRLADLLRREHHALAEFLVALAAFDRECKWSKLGHNSLFSFLRRDLGLSAGAAQYRKTAAELIQRFPEVEAALRDGQLCLSSVIELAKVLTRENASEVLPRFFGLSSRDAAFVAASIRPVENPPRREFVVRSIPAPTVPSGGDPLQAANDPCSPSTQVRAPETTLTAVNVSASPATSNVSARTLDRPVVKPLDAERARVSMTVSQRLLQKLAAARDALSHSHPGASEEQILEVGLDLILARATKRRGLVDRPRKAAPSETPTPVVTAPGANEPAAPASRAKRSRYVPADVRRAVWKRDQGRCQWPLEGGGVCGSTYQVELDHIDGFARGGETSVERCRVLCRPHQDVSARELYGDEKMNAFTRPKGGGRCSEPVATYAG